MYVYYGKGLEIQIANFILKSVLKNVYFDFIYLISLILI